MATRSAIVTGSGGGGSGRAIARRLARAGFAVAVCDIDDAGGRETVTLIERDGGRAAFCRADISKEEEVRGLTAFAEKLAPLGVLVNNASSHAFDHDRPLDGWPLQVEVDLLGAMFTIRHAVDAMRRAGGGAIVNVASISALWHGRKQGAGIPAYDAAKAGVIHLTSGLGGLAKSDRIRVNCLCPGWIATHGPLEYWQSLTPEERRANGVPAMLLTPEQIADAVFRLATDETLAGRIVLWWSEDAPQLIAEADRGYHDTEAFRVA
jgi:NAD(P)-dependent dehydrogenase (short-subunit alcohol dehydrogenase family)